MKRLGLALAASAAILAAAVAIGLLVGSVPVSPARFLSSDPVAAAILGLRWPRVALAATTGAALALSGAALQALLRNPLGDPFLLGTSGGAAAGAALAMLAGASVFASPAAAFAGAVVATAAVASLARRSGRLDVQRLILSGVIANAFFSAVILLAFALSSGAQARSLLFWMMGSLSDARASQIPAAFAYLAIGGFGILRLAPSLNLVLTGEEDAMSLGVAVERTKIAVFLLAALLAGAATAFVGIIGFVGLLAPHLARLLWGNDQRVLLPASGLLGAALLVMADTISRALFSPVELPIGAVTALVGVPFFVFLLTRNK